jgi:hypothetical protein
LRERFGEKVRIKLFSSDRSFFGRRGIGGALGAAFAERILTDLDERALFERYRL